MALARETCLLPTLQNRTGMRGCVEPTDDTGTGARQSCRIIWILRPARKRIGPAADIIETVFELWLPVGLLRVMFPVGPGLRVDRFTRVRQQPRPCPADFLLLIISLPEIAIVCGPQSTSPSRSASGGADAFGDLVMAAARCPCPHLQHSAKNPESPCARVNGRRHGR